LRIFTDDIAQPIALGDGWIERKDDQGELAICRQKLAADDLVAHHPIDHCVVGGIFGHLIWKQRRWNHAVFRWLTCRENRDDAARAIDQLEVCDESAQLLDRFPREQCLALDYHEHIELARRKTSRHLFILLELLRVRTEQLAERIVDLDSCDAEPGGDRERDHDKGNSQGKSQGH
jgi:hypothetical protein